MAHADISACFFMLIRNTNGRHHQS